MPFAIQSPAYIVEEGRVKDATYIVKAEVGGPATETVVPHEAQRRTKPAADVGLYPRHPSPLEVAEANEQIARNEAKRPSKRQRA
jgi:hypothetical protein